ncbi:MAG: hypothetical protein AVDCRST_MAG77-4596 [uncultured Chloroflexi bacterium]|uniref:Class F sortase n=1 Tax=uncultured Chloroflexota bacterium TaxID=166587 RepID=A0A6J4JX45_9CHLR|nr:MAG: hypothetical protein AVDCRST_MAG77-4596 [uncultured Chloroflexota bacterium]
MAAGGPSAGAAAEAPAAAGAEPEAEADAGASPAPAQLVLLAPRGVRIPRIGVSARVVHLGVAQSGEWEVPDEDVGWYRHTAPPGTPGNAVLAGHLNSPWGLPRVFARLRELRAGDLVEIDLVDVTDPRDDGARSTAPSVGRYRVAETRLVPSTAVDVLAPTDDDRLTLITCAGTWNIGRREYSHRHVVIARPEA